MSEDGSVAFAVAGGVLIVATLIAFAAYYPPYLNLRWSAE